MYHPPQSLFTLSVAPHPTMFKMNQVARVETAVGFATSCTTGLHDVCSTRPHLPSHLPMICLPNLLSHPSASLLKLNRCCWHHRASLDFPKCEPNYSQLNGSAATTKLSHKNDRLSLSTGGLDQMPYDVTRKRENREE